MVADHRPAVVEDQGRDRVRAHLAVGELGVLGEVGRSQPLEILAIWRYVGNAR